MPSLLQLRSIYLKGWWYKTMPIITSSFVSFLFISVQQVRLEDIQVLGTLPALRTLYLRSEVTIKEEHERSFMLRADAFPRMTRCLLYGILFGPNMFPRGAMPMVYNLHFGLLVSDVLSGGDLFIKNLPSLTDVCITLYGEELESERYSEAEAALERAAADHPNRPTTDVLSQRLTR